MSHDLVLFVPGWNWNDKIRHEVKGHALLASSPSHGFAPNRRNSASIVSWYRYSADTEREGRKTMNSVVPKPSLVCEVCEPRSCTVLETGRDLCENDIASPEEGEALPDLAHASTLRLVNLSINGYPFHRQKYDRIV